MLPVYIHSSGRPTIALQTSLHYLRNVPDLKLYLVVQEAEDKRYRFYFEHDNSGVEVLTLPQNIRTLSPTRQWILERAATHDQERVVMMDDDLKFSFRKDGEVYLTKATPESMHAMLTEIEASLGRYVHVGVSAREGNNRVPEAQKEVGRMMRVLAYRPRDVLALGCTFDRMRTKQDFDMTLQLLRKGYPNLILYNYAQDQGGSQSAGGCAAYRTPEMMREDAHTLASLHPGFVKVVEKTTKGAWGGGSRIDVQIAWKKAYEEGRRVHDLG